MENGNCLKDVSHLHVAFEEALVMPHQLHKPMVGLQCTEENVNYRKSGEMFETRISEVHFIQKQGIVSISP